jgi:hypothetical protein
MKLSFLLILFILQACQDLNSNSSDNTKYGPLVLNAGGDTNFVSAFQIINNRCISCHSGYHNNWSGQNSDNQWLNSGYINRGDPNNSLLIKRIINSGEVGANMPQDADSIPESEFAALKNWITHIP